MVPCFTRKVWQGIKGKKNMFSIIIPFHKKNKFISEAIASVREQTLQDYEIILVPNGEVLKETKFIESLAGDKIRICPCDETGKVGKVKSFGCKQAKGDYLVELDYDDLLTPDCLEKLQIEIDKDKPDFLFSNFCQVNLDGETDQLWSNYYGWEYRDYNYKGKILKETLSPEFTPQNISRIWFNANHIRVWKKEFYDRIGGHDESMTISDDHDLVLRSYLKGKCRHIDDTLYIYRVHENNTTWLLNAEIQETMWLTYDRYIWQLMEKWSDDNGLRKIDLAGGINPKEGYENYDLRNAQIIGDLDETWKLEDNSVGILRADNAIEHFKDPIHTMNEAYRVLKHGGAFMILVPSTDGQGAWCDPTHVSFWNLRSFRYYTESQMRMYIEPKCKAKFQIMKCVNINLWGLPFCEVHLIAVKEGRYHGEYNW